MAGGAGHTGGLTNPRPWRGRCRAGYSNTGGPPLPRKRAPLKKKPANPMVTPSPSSHFGFLMQHVGLDLFSYAHKDFLICVDHWSGYPLYHQLRSLTSESVLRVLANWFNLLGWPSSIRSDGGPQFRGEFSRFCSSHSIVHQVSAPYNPKSNGLPEAGVKSTSYANVLLLDQTLNTGYTSGGMCRVPTAIALLNSCLVGHSALLYPLCLFSIIPLISHLQHLPRMLLRRCLLYTSPSPRDRQKSRMPSSA